MKKRVLSLLTSVVMIISCVSGSVFGSFATNEIATISLKAVADDSTTINLTVTITGKGDADNAASADGTLTLDCSKSGAKFGTIPTISKTDLNNGSGSYKIKVTNLKPDTKYTFDAYVTYKNSETSATDVKTNTASDSETTDKPEITKLRISPEETNAEPGDKVRFKVRDQDKEEIDPEILDWSIKGEKHKDTEIDEEDGYLYISKKETSSKIYVIVEYDNGDDELKAEAVVYLNAGYDIRDARIDRVSDQKYTGKAVTPSVNVVHDGSTLREGRDYKISYSNNTRPGKATIYIEGIGDYEGTATITFTIEEDKTTPTGEIIGSKAQNAIDTALKNNYTDTAYAKLTNPTTVSSDALRIISSTATNAGKEAVILADTRVSGKVVTRITADPSSLNGGVNLSTSTTNARATKSAANLKKTFSNKLGVVSMGQRSSYGTTVKIATKIPAGITSTSNLKFYSYNPTTGKVTKINTTYKIDANNYIHFATNLGYDLVISQGDLAR